MTDEDSRRDALREFAAGLGISFADLTLMDMALTHASMAADGPDAPPDYESLEFLGDAVLGLAAAHYLFERHPGLTPGEYTRLRAALVNRDTVARVGAALDIAPLIRLGRGEEMSGGRTRKALIADCTEALIGAVYLDCGWDCAREFVIRIFGDEFVRVEQASHTEDYKSRLQEYCQAKRLPLPVFEVVEEHGPDHEKEFVVEVCVDSAPCGRGRGRSKKEAQQQAAREALQLRTAMDAQEAKAAETCGVETVPTGDGG
jgi:ribonuclease-3